MIENLRRKLAITNMVATSIVFIAAAIILMFSTMSRLDVVRNDNMQRALDYPWQDAEQEDFAHDFSDVVLVVYENGQVKQLLAGDNIEAEFVQLIFKNISQIVKSNKNPNYTSLRLQYAKQNISPGVTKVVFYDPSNVQSGRLALISYSIVTLIVVMFSYSVISTTLAQSAISPIEESWKKQRQFVADASHELKTPLSVIMANTEIIASHPDDTVQSQMKWINNTLAEAKRMASLVQDLLFLAKSDDGAKVEMSPTNLSECVQSCVLTSEALFYENNKIFDSQIDQDIYVEGNEGQLKQLVTILLDNANKYAIGDGNINLALTATNRNAILTVTNDSNEVSSEQIVHLFDRFYTMDTSRNKNHGGNGLGLSIAERIVQSHGGTIIAEYQNGKMTFRATIPTLRHKRASKA